MASIQFDHYIGYDELTEYVKHVAEEHSPLVCLESIGNSYEGRDVWCLGVTNRATGEAESKPAVVVDGNIHAMEVASSVAVLNLLHDLITGFDSDEEIRFALDTRAFYLIPRVNPDGAELALTGSPKLVRSSVRPYPGDVEAKHGVVAEDIDGDGRILNMRIPDPNGRWKRHPDDPRLMVLRDPVERGGEYFTLASEGRVLNYDGVSIHHAPPREGLDLNLNFPFEWKPDSYMMGAGPYPLSEPETRALADFAVGHPNVCTWIAGHTPSGVLLRPSFVGPDTDLATTDLNHYKMVGERGYQLTGYRAISLYEDFTLSKEQRISGSINWIWDSFGIYLWVVEFWNPHVKAGVKVDNYAEWLIRHDAEDQLKMLSYCDDVLDGHGFVDWYSFDHPDLGPIELGGWDVMQYIFNPPPMKGILQKEVAPVSEWAIWQLNMSPLLEWREERVEKISDGIWRVTAYVQNVGYLPTNLSIKALELQSVGPVIAEIELLDGIELTSGSMQQPLGQLGGRAHRFPMNWHIFFAEPTDDRCSASWQVRGNAGDRVNIRFSHSKAGSVQKTVQLLDSAQ